MFNGIPDNILVVDMCFGGDLSADHDHAGLGDGLAGNLAVGIFLQVSVQNGVWDLIAHFVCKID